VSAVVTAATTLACTHGGPATSTAPSASVTITGSPVMTVTPSPSYAVVCPVSPAPRCLTAMWVTGALKVFSHELALAVQGSMSVCQPTMARLEIQSIQQSVVAQ
jgi:hypothetical protein